MKRTFESSVISLGRMHKKKKTVDLLSPSITPLETQAAAVFGCWISSKAAGCCAILDQS